MLGLWQHLGPIPTQHGSHVRRPVLQNPLRRGQALVRYSQQHVPHHVRQSHQPTARDQASDVIVQRHVRNLGHCLRRNPAQQFAAFQYYE